MPRLFSVRSEPFRLTKSDRLRLAEAIRRPGDLPDSVLDAIKTRLSRARSETALGMDAPRSTTKAGGDELRRMEASARELANTFQSVGDEAQHFLDFEVPYDGAESAALLAIQIRFARERHDHNTDLEKRKASDGAPMKWVALSLAEDLAPFWAEWSGLGWSHNGPWGHFVSIAFELAGVEASAKTMARNAAKSYRDGENERAVSTEGVK